MNKIIGIRREDKNEWERRVSLIPEHIRELKDKFDIHTIIQPSEIRIFQKDEFQDNLAEVNEDLSSANPIFAVKEIPIKLLEENKTYIFFSHTIKGQDYNMPLLKRMMDLKCNLIDYERIVNEKNQRLIFFGKFAGLAGMIETLVSYAEKLKKSGFDTPLSKIKQAYEYKSLDDAKTQIVEIGNEISESGLPPEIGPIVVGFAGYGNVSQGAQEIYDLLPNIEISPSQLLNNNLENDKLYKVVFKEEDMMQPLEGEFVLQNYYNHPEKYTSIFENYLPKMQVLVNCIYWTEDYPRLITKEYLHKNADSLNLSVIGDISCDIGGSVEITNKATYPDNPCFTYNPSTKEFNDGSNLDGVTVMAVDNLPCEFSAEASTEFSDVLKNYVNDIIIADFNKDYEELSLPHPIKKALILHKGQLTKEYKYINEFIKTE
ncbi:MAG: hypothetical protein H8E71_06875 [Candidatus Marinimicrobia bacterium]|nr:hypothetical protein [Candidatus Neomarinimicrobiota bacterium]MBL7109698.1 hypothetical protein [Candidatus Neomarinimicrobiota bacterium]